MGLVALTCPKCGGEIQMDSSLTSGFCIYCGAKIINDKAVVGKVTLNRQDELINCVKLARASLVDGDRVDCKTYTDKALMIEPDCRDAWFLKAVLEKSDERQYEINRSRGMRGQVDLGIFTEKDLNRLWDADLKSKNENTKIFFYLGLFMILFFGGSLSLALGLSMGTFIPAIVTVVLIVLLIVGYTIYNKSLKKRNL